MRRCGWDRWSRIARIEAAGSAIGRLRRTRARGTAVKGDGPAANVTRKNVESAERAWLCVDGETSSVAVRYAAKGRMSGAAVAGSGWPVKVAKRRTQSR